MPLGIWILVFLCRVLAQSAFWSRTVYKISSTEPLNSTGQTSSCHVTVMMLNRNWSTLVLRMWNNFKCSWIITGTCTNQAQPTQSNFVWSLLLILHINIFRADPATGQLWADAGGHRAGWLAEWDSHGPAGCGPVLWPPSSHHPLQDPIRTSHPGKYLQIAMKAKTSFFHKQSWTQTL